eukprot:gene7607-9356_t
MGGSVDDSTKYNKKTAFVFIFNLVIGVGCLNLPFGFKDAGLILGLIFLACIAFLAYVTTTWLIECQSAANYLIRVDKTIDGSLSSVSSESSALINSIEEDIDVGYGKKWTDNYNDPSTDPRFNIKTRVEVGLMAKIFLGNIGHKIFYFILVIYLFGDLAIYAVTVPTSLATVTGGYSIGSLHMTSYSVYYLYLILFAVFVTPFSLFNFQKTKYLQIVTLFTRNVAFFMMIILSIIFIAQGKGASITELPLFEIKSLPKMFGVSIYAFMCHHSLPSIITPIEKKKKLTFLMAIDFLCILIAYSALCITALFAFGNVTNPTCTPNNIHTFIPCTIQSLYIFNFSSYNVKFIADFLALFPVFTLSTNYILISITLRNNLMQLITWKSDTSRPFLRSSIFSLASALIPIGIAFGTRNIDFLVSITGSYAGLGIMFVMPCLISYFSNRMLKDKYYTDNPNKSVFSKLFFYILIISISIVSLGLTTYNNIL